MLASASDVGCDVVDVLSDLAHAAGYSDDVAALFRRAEERIGGIGAHVEEGREEDGGVGCA